MKDTYYIKLDINTFEDRKIKLLKKMCGLEGFGRYVFVVLAMRNEEDSQLEYGNPTWESLADDFRCSEEDAKQFIDDCIEKFVHKGRGLFVKKDDNFFSERLTKDVTYLNEVRESKKIAGKKGMDSRWHSEPNDMAKMIACYEDKMGKPLQTSRDWEIIKDIAGNYSLDQFQKAVDEAVTKNGRSLGYVVKILENQQKKQEPVRRSYSDSDKMREA